ncbi:hypothetical protein HDV63DRAFT_8285 [Trichoderma sp. SZMC 28014]
MKSDRWVDVVVRHSRYVPRSTRGLRSETLTAPFSSPLLNLSTTTSITAWLFILHWCSVQLPCSEMLSCQTRTPRFCHLQSRPALWRSKLCTARCSGVSYQRQGTVGIAMTAKQVIRHFCPRRTWTTWLLASSSTSKPGRDPGTLAMGTWEISQPWAIIKSATAASTKHPVISSVRVTNYQPTSQYLCTRCLFQT